VVTSGSQILPILRPSLAKKAEDFLSRVGVTVIKNNRVESVAPLGTGTGAALTKTVVALADGKTLEADLYIPATGMKHNTSLVDRELLTSSGCLDTNTNLSVEKAGPRVYAVGDIASCGRPAVPRSIISSARYQA
jgi:NADH dehydrogenase FAD-containing subunit